VYGCVRVYLFFIGIGIEPNARYSPCVGPNQRQNALAFCHSCLTFTWSLFHHHVVYLFLRVCSVNGCTALRYWMRGQCRWMHIILDLWHGL